MSPSEDHTVSLTIQTAQGVWNDATFKEEDKVKQVIEAVIAHFGFSPNGKYELTLKGHSEPLNPDRTLESYRIKSGSILIFTEKGTAV